jgi:uncharacterized spore protein YtfJ
MDAIKALFERLEKVPEEINVDAVFGKPETVGERTLIPVAELSYGFGVGAGTAPATNEACCAQEGGDADEPAEDEEEQAVGAGGGAGARARPIAYIEVGPDGTQVKSIIDEQKVALAGILLSVWAVGWLGLVLKTLFTRRS